MTRPPTRARKAQRPAALIACLAVLAALAVVAGAVAALLLLSREARFGAVGTVALAKGAGCVLGGVAVGCMLWGVAHLVSRQGRMAAIQDSLAGSLGLQPGEPPTAPSEQADRPSTAAQTPPAAAPAPVGEGDRRLLEQILAQLVELNENILLTGEQREARRQAREEALSGRFTDLIERAMGEEEFDAAEGHLTSFIERSPGNPICERLAGQLAEARQAARRRDVEACTRQVQDLMATSSFARAEELAEQLRGQYPADADVAELFEHVRREAETFETERRGRMYGEVQKSAAARQWRSALDAARRFIEAYPDSVDADAVRAMVPTIEGNAKLEEVRELRDRIRDLIERRRYAEAADYAQDLIQRYPDTRAAAELMGQLARLRELGRANPTNGPAGP